MWVFQQLPDRINQLASIRAQFTDAMSCHALEHPQSPRQQRHRHKTPVIAPSASVYIAAPLQAIDEFCRAVMFQHHAIRQRSDRRLATLRQPANSQEHQILLWFKTGRARRNLHRAEIAGSTATVYRITIYLAGLASVVVPGDKVPGPPLLAIPGLGRSTQPEATQNSFNIS